MKSTLNMELQPVHGGGAADEQQLVLAQMEQDAVTDHVPGVARRHHLLGAVHREVGEAVESREAAQLERVRPLERELGHVVALIEQHGGVAPGALLVAPVGEFARHHGVHVRADLRVAQHVHGVAGSLEYAFEILRGHGSP
jgi:hypothetical protein